MDNNNEIRLGIEEQKAIIQALLIGLESYGEIERIDDEVDKYDLIASENLIPQSVRPVHPTGAILLGYLPQHCGICSKFR